LLYIISQFDVIFFKSNKNVQLDGYLSRSRRQKYFPKKKITTSFSGKNLFFWCCGVVDTKELAFFCCELNLLLLITKLFYYLVSKSCGLLLYNDCVFFYYHKSRTHKSSFFQLIYKPSARDLSDYELKRSIFFGLFLPLYYHMRIQLITSEKKRIELRKESLSTAI
jgi:hypothetical protein